MEEPFDEQKLARALKKLPAWKRVAFMARIGARLVPNYERFSAETGFGDVSVLKRAFDAAWDWVETGRRPENLAELRAACEKQAPDTEDFRSPYTSAALDAASVAEVTLKAIEHPDEADLTTAPSLARDTVDMFVQQLLDLDPNAPGFEEAILEHEFMQRELKRQRADLEALTKLSGDRKAAGRRLRASAAKVSGSLES